MRITNWVNQKRADKLTYVSLLYLIYYCVIQLENCLIAQCSLVLIQISCIWHLVTTKRRASAWWKLGVLLSPSPLRPNLFTHSETCVMCLDGIPVFWSVLCCFVHVCMCINIYVYQLPIKPFTSIFSFCSTLHLVAWLISVHI